MSAIKSYNEAIEKLNKLDSNFTFREKFKTCDKSTLIPEMLEWCRLCGYDRTDFDRFNAIHITGSKGKGSTAAFVFSILSQYLPKSSKEENAAIKKLGLYTSPHLLSVRERIRIRESGEVPMAQTPISEEKFAKRFFEIWERLGMEKKPPHEGPPFFKFLTLTAFHTFLEEAVDTAIVEVGIGGEYDSTNVLHRPSVCAITSLGLDHTDMLGETIEEIAWMKGGIMKEGCPAFTVPQPEGALAVLKERAAEKNAVLKVVPIHPDIESMRLGLAGDFQKVNASLAAAVAAAHLRSMGYPDIPDDITNAPLPEKFRKGLMEAVWPGRCETRKALGVTWCLDGAHTVESIGVLGTWFAEKIRANMSSERILMFNQQTRNALSLLHQLRRSICDSAGLTGNQAPFTHVIFCTNIPWAADTTFSAEHASMNHSGKSPEDLQVQNELARIWKDIEGEEHTRVTVVRSVEEAIRCVRSLHPAVADGMDSQAQTSGSHSPISLITGSLHLVGSAMEVLDTLV